MNMTDAGAPVHHRRPVLHRIAATVIGAGIVVGGFAVGAADAAPAAPIRDWVPTPRPPALTVTEAAELLPGSMATVRDAMLAGQQPEIDSATRSYIAQGRALEAQEAEEVDGRLVYVSRDAKDHPQYRRPPVFTGDAKDHAGYGPSGRVSTRPLWQS